MGNVATTRSGLDAAAVSDADILRVVTGAGLFDGTFVLDTSSKVSEVVVLVVVCWWLCDGCRAWNGV